VLPLNSVILTSVILWLCLSGLDHLDKPVTHRSTRPIESPVPGGVQAPDGKRIGPATGRGECVVAPELGIPVNDR